MSNLVRAGRVTRNSRSTPVRAAGGPGAVDAALTGTPAAPFRVALHHPFAFGFFAAAGSLLAWWLGTLILNVGSLIVLIVVAMFLAAGLNPLVEGLGRQGVRRSFAVLIVTLGFLIALGIFLIALVPVIADQVNSIIDKAPGWLEALRENRLVETLDERFDMIERAQSFVTSGSFGGQLFGGVVGVGLAVLSAVANVFVVIVLTLYFLASLPRIKQAGYRLAPASKRAKVEELGDTIVSNVGGYVSGAFLVGLAAGLSSLIFLFAVGLGEYAVALALVVALLDVIPMIGATLGALIVTLIGFAEDPTIGIACVVFYVVYQQVENYLIYPRVMERSVNIPGSVIVIAALVGAGLLGVIGALLAIPTAAALLLILREVVHPRLEAR